jgi:glycosyltransferase involved in cell wall biosynthesis
VKLVSVIIPARNAADTLARTLDSLALQHWRQWEAIIVNDGSVDGTAGLAAAYCDRDPRFRMIETASTGVADARNAGLRHARGEALLFLDADDWVVPAHLARLTAALSDNPEAGASYCGYVRVTPQGQAFLPRFSPQVSTDPVRAFARGNPLPPASVMLRRGPVEKLDGFDTRYRTCEDWKLWTDLVHSGVQFAPVEDLHSRYFLRPNSASADVAQLVRDAERLIESRDPRSDCEDKITSLSWFALWCGAVAAGQGQPAPEKVSELPAVHIAEEAVSMTASLVIEGLCTGACRPPSHLVRDWPQTSHRLRELVLRQIEGPAREIVFEACARMLGIASTPAADLVSVVIPAYKATQTLGETLQSVQTQTHAPLDIIVVDDGSPDETATTAFAFAATDPRISVVHQDNAGVAEARNHGWKLAASDFIAFVDADDLWAPAKIERQLAALRAEGDRAGLAYTWYARIDADSLITSRSHKPDAEGDVLRAIFLGNFIGNGSAALMTRAALEHAGGFDSTLHARGAQGCEDFSIYFRIAEKYRFARVPEPLTGYRVLPGNMSGDRIRMLRSFDLVATEMLGRHPGHRQAIVRGRRYFLEWSLLTATENGDFGTASTLFLAHLRQTPMNALVTLVWKIPRAALRGARLRIVGTPRRRRDYTPRRFPIGGVPGEPVPEASGA